MTMIANTYDFARFNSTNAFAVYLGLVPGENSSGQKENNTSITKMGNSYMRKAMVEVGRQPSFINDFSNYQHTYPKENTVKSN